MNRKGIDRRTVLAGTAAGTAVAAFTGKPETGIERLFMALVVVKRTMRRANDDVWERLSDRETALLNAIAAEPARNAHDVIRKVQAWALVMNVNPDECREGPSPELPHPVATGIVASLLEDTQRLPGASLHGLEYQRRNLPGWRKRRA